MSDDRTHHERNHFDPPLKVWIVPTDHQDLLPLPALLHSETEHEIIVSEYNRRKQCFELFERERRATAHRDFEACRIAMLQEQSAVLEKAKAEAANQASIYNHILSVPRPAFPDDAYEAFTAKPEAQEEEAVQEEVKLEEPPADEKPAPMKRPARRR